MTRFISINLKLRLIKCVFELMSYHEGEILPVPGICLRFMKHQSSFQGFKLLHNKRTWCPLSRSDVFFKAFSPSGFTFWVGFREIYLWKASGCFFKCCVLEETVCKWVRRIFTVIIEGLKMKSSETRNYLIHGNPNNSPSIVILHLNCFH